MQVADLIPFAVCVLKDETKRFGYGWYVNDKRMDLDLDTLSQLTYEYICYTMCMFKITVECISCLF